MSVGVGGVVGVLVISGWLGTGGIATVERVMMSCMVVSGAQIQPTVLLTSIRIQDPSALRPLGLTVWFCATCVRTG